MIETRDESLVNLMKRIRGFSCGVWEVLVIKTPQGYQYVAVRKGDLEH
jgi:hypothetical protein